jgi:hypothetical protein
MIVPKVISLLALLVYPITAFPEFSYRGNAGLELKYFTADPIVADQTGNTISASIEPEFYWSFNDADSLAFTPFLRADSADDSRSHGDIRELLWLHVGEGWELRSGIGKVFWGVTESIHLVDIVNQTDLVENLDQEDKLGQPMFWLSVPKDWGTLDLFALPYFRERTFPGIEGRFRTIPVVDKSLTIYESVDEESHLDWAMRWSHYVGSLDFGISAFDGTSRDPQFIPKMSDGGQIVLAPHYPQIRQYSVDIQSVLDAWLLKLEYIHRDFDSADSYNAAVGGFEYTFGSIFDRRADLGVIMEYLYDSRDENGGPFQDDLFTGIRIAFNDTQSTELLTGIIGDLHNGARLFTLEAARRLGDRWTMKLEARAFSSIPDDDPLSSQREDDYVQFSLEYFF